MQTAKTFTKSEGGKLSKVVEYGTGARVEIPMNPDGSVRWYGSIPYTPNQLISVTAINPYFKRKEIRSWEINHLRYCSHIVKTTCKN